MQTIYFDYNATTPLDPGVREAMLPYLGEIYGNPSSVHHVGRRARSLLDDARDRVATVWACKPSEIIFTSGGTESINLALCGVTRHLRPKGRHIITSSIEHHAVLHCCAYLQKQEGLAVTYLPVDPQGRVDPDAVAAAIRPDTVLVSIMAANNETGTLQAVVEIGDLCHQHGVLFHTDAVQWFGKESFTNIHQFNADLVSACSHKYHGPKGAGALFVRSPLLPDPILFGGGHENERRAGTENLPAIIGFTEATERFVKTPVFSRPHLQPLNDRLVELLDRLAPEGVTTHGHPHARLLNTLAFTVEGSDSIALLAGLDLEGICASSGSACSAGSIEPSHVMTALGLPSELANALIRFSIGRGTTLEEIDLAAEILPRVIHRVQRHR